MIRKATSADLPAMIALQKSVEIEGALHGYFSDSPEEWSTRDLTWTLVTIIDDQPVGFIHCAPRKHSGECVFPPDAKILEIVDLIIAPGARAQRGGSGLVAALQIQARSEGFTHLRVYSAAKRFDDIVKFYRKCGFTPWYLEMTNKL